MTLIVRSYKRFSVVSETNSEILCSLKLVKNKMSIKERTGLTMSTGANWFRLNYT